MDIREIIKEEMEKKGQTYRGVAAKCGWSAQNLWIKLNRVDANYDTIITILKALGTEIEIQKDDKPAELSPEERALKIEKSAKDKRVSFDVIDGLVQALGYKIVLKDIPEKSQK